MDQIHKQVARARRRLWLELFLNRLIRCWFVTLLAAAAAIAIPRLVTIENLPAQWTAWWLGGGVAAGLLVALAWTWLRGRSEMDAAMEIDRRFELKERVASSLSLGADAAQTPAGRALLADATHAIGRLEIDERFRIRVGRAAWLPLGPALVAVALVMAMDVKLAQSSPDPSATTIDKKTMDNSSAPLRKRLVEQAKQAAAKDLKEAEELLLKQDKEIAKMAAQKNIDRKQTLVKFNDLKKELEDRRDKLGGDNELKKQLAGMKDLEKGPGDKMADAMKNGQWDKARQELDKLKQDLKEGKLDDANKKALQKQMEQMQRKLEDAAKNRQQAMEDLKKQVEQKKKEGKLAEAGEMQQKLDQMKKQQNQMKQLEKLAQQMAQAQQAMQKGDQQAAAQAMEQMQQQMEQMQKEMTEGEMLDMAMEQLEMAKNAMGCKECQGAGCKACEGNQLSNKMSERPGQGMGAGRGAGPRPDEKNDVAFRDSQVKQNPGKGAAVIIGEAEGPNVRGNVREEIKAEMASQGSEPADPLVIEQLPKTQRENAEEYFNRLRDGE